MKKEIATLEMQNFSEQQLKLITDTVAKGATKEELQLFLYRCKHLDLDPLKPGQIHFVKYGNGPGTIVVGIEGFRVTAHRTGKLSGIKRGALKDNKGQLIGAWAEVYRTDWVQPAREEVPLSEYNTGRGPWSKMPETMIKKVAEAAALRMAFPENLGGIYTQEEMNQAESENRSQNRFSPDQPGPGDGIVKDPMEDGKIPYGKFALKRPQEIDEQDLRDYVNYLDGVENKKGLTDKAKLTRDFIADYLGRVEQEILGTNSVEEDFLSFDANNLQEK